MKIYLLTLLSFIACLAILLAIKVAPYSADSASFMCILTAILCVPLLIIAGMCAYMSSKLKQQDSKSIFLTSFHNLHIVLSAIYFVFMIFALRLYTPFFPGTETDTETCDNSMMTEFIEEPHKHKYNMALAALNKEALARTGDTLYCVDQIESANVDTTIRDIRMDTQVTVSLHFANDNERFYAYQFYCNDTIGFTATGKYNSFVDEEMIRKFKSVRP